MIGLAPRLAVLLLAVLVSGIQISRAESLPEEYQEIRERLAQGWNTWNTRSVLSHVLLPEGSA